MEHSLPDGTEGVRDGAAKSDPHFRLPPQFPRTYFKKPLTTAAEQVCDSYLELLRKALVPARLRNQTLARALLLRAEDLNMAVDALRSIFVGRSIPKRGTLSKITNMSELEQLEKFELLDLYERIQVIKSSHRIRPTRMANATANEKT